METFLYRQETNGLKDRYMTEFRLRVVLNLPYAFFYTADIFVDVFKGGKMKIRKTMAVLTAAALLSVFALTGCGNDTGNNPGSSGSSDDEKRDSVTIAMQNGMSYAPLTIMKEKKLVEKYCEGIEVNWTTLNSGSAVNEGMASGDIDFGGMGLSPAITAAASGLKIKIASSLDSMPNQIMTNDPDIRTLSDIQKDDKIAAVNIGSFQHLLLAMAAEDQLGDAKALDRNVVAMSHPDATVALTSGTIDLQVTNPPYLYQEMEDSSLHVVEGISDVWPTGNSTIVLTATEDIHDNDRATYDGVIRAVQEAIDYINEDPEGAAGILAEADDLDPLDYQRWLEEEETVFSTECKGIMKAAEFMDENGFMDKKAPESFRDLAFDNVKGD
jgi:NitT/TauT family transport system substrate-binding protein